MYLLVIHARATLIRYPKPRGSKVARNNRSSRGPGNEANHVLHEYDKEVLGGNNYDSSLKTCTHMSTSVTCRHVYMLVHAVTFSKTMCCALYVLGIICGRGHLSLE